MPDLKDVLGEFYRPSAGDLKRYVTEATVVLDASVLLDLYRLGTSERAQVFDVLDMIESRLWIPYQAGFEYQRNRLGVVAAQANAYEALRSLHGARDTEQMKKALKGLSLPDEVRGQVGALLPDLADQLISAVADYQAAITKLIDAHVVTTAQARSADPVRARLDALLVGRVGTKPDRKTQDERVKEGVRRSNAGIPPGYKDADKDGDSFVAGDYLVWAGILEYAKESETSLLFVTKDQKEDWFERSGGEITGPRTELVAEFAEQNAHGYHQLTLGRFLTLANEFLSAQVDEATIERVSEASPPTGLETRRAWQMLAELPPESLEAWRQSTLLPPGTLEAWRQSTLLPPGTLEAWRRGMAQLSPDTLRAFQNLANQTYWQRMRDAQRAAADQSDPGQESSDYEAPDDSASTDEDDEDPQ
ncbi:PIN-like domain-containing protein [Kribbella sp. NPDC004875]|uniref:PIN-like domain-containing protein n=1 Tax=Kribbella sp. NPDC004875 TaxID=3364107 RepID=UPI0036B9087F